MQEKILKSYKSLIAIPVVIMLLSLVLLGVNGLDKSVDLKGGSLAVMELDKDITSQELTTLINEKMGISNTKVTSIVDNKATVEFGDTVDVTKLTNSLKGTASITSFSSVGPVLSEAALNQIYWALGFAFMFMAVTVFIVFREIVPSIAVILAALFDIIIAFGGMSLFHVSLSVASVGAILMLIGYSVDTDILLTTRLLKRKEGTVDERSVKAFKTGITMSFASIMAMVTLYLVTVFIIPEADVLSDIAAVLVMGLIADVISTWCMNLGLLRWYLERGK
jgi:preprotein translocase subunit SecF